MLRDYFSERWAALTSRVRVSARSRPSPPLYPHFNRPSGFWPCVKSCLVGGSDKYWATPRPFGRAGWHSCRMGYRNQEQTRGRIGPQLRLGNLRVGELHFCLLCHPCTALDQASSLNWHTCPDPHLGSWNCLPHQAHIALSEPISSTD